MTLFSHAESYTGIRSHVYADIDGSEPSDAVSLSSKFLFSDINIDPWSGLLIIWQIIERLGNIQYIRTLLP
ncbi:MAG: hypothetical protein J07HQW1_01189 [Haloquadratum walsbyi J07HQW1]|uniref:Uncharacterized protein n=1 Tax=Haloquadratum walsbyi J07HQW1 TaxID=1238424 RepID=U1PC54_9EURY|nr:MAG: hypothetical protein J07HQW1_01189 [Haloquadratum walsbyi J07HQW1]